MSGHVVVATGFNREVNCVKRLAGVVAVAGGGDPVALRLRIEAAAAGARGIVSFGMAGALGDGVMIGDWVVADRLWGAVEADCDPAWRRAIADRLPSARIGSVYADGRMINTVSEKLALAERYGALAVDMESHVAAAAAAEQRLPFAIVRCVSDGASHPLPHAITVSMRADGRVDVMAMLRSLVTQPRQTYEFARSMANFARAMGELRRGAMKIGTAMASQKMDQETG